MPYAPPTWQLQSGQTLLQNAAVILSLKDITITPAEFRFLFVAKTPDQRVLDFAVSSSIDRSSFLGRVRTILGEYRSEFSSLAQHAMFSRLKWLYRRATTGDLQFSERTLETTTQHLGILGGWSVGVVHCERTNRARQEITLHVSLTGSQDFSWHLTPLRQLVWQPHRESARYTLSISQDELPEIQWVGPIMREQVGYFVHKTKKQPGREKRSIFVRLDHPSKVTMLTKSEYLAIAQRAYLPH